MHKAHVEEKLKIVQEALAQHEQDAASLAATMLVFFFNSPLKLFMKSPTRVLMDSRGGCHATSI
jgi:hypothetical protein